MTGEAPQLLINGYLICGGKDGQTQFFFCVPLTIETGVPKSCQPTGLEMPSDLTFNMA